MSEEDSRSDQELIEAANHGDAQALEALYTRHRDWAYACAYGFCRQCEDAQEVVQDVFRYLFGKFPDFELTAKLTTFLYPVIRHRSIDRIRRRKPQEELHDIHAATDIRDEQQERNRVAEMVAGLPEKFREVVILRFVDGMKLEEIGQEMGIPTGTVKSRLNHALGQLRQRPPM